MKVSVLTESEYDAYSQFILGFDVALFYYSIKYKLFLEELLEADSNYLLAKNSDGIICGVLPLMKKSGPYGNVYNTLPYYGSNGGVISTSNEAASILLKEYEDILEMSAAGTYIENPLNGREINIKHDYMDYRIGQFTKIDFEDDIENNVLSEYHSKTRNMVRKAIKEKVNVSIDNSELEFLYNVHKDNMLAIGGKAKDQRFFKLIPKYFESGMDYDVYIAEYNGVKISAMLVFYFNKIVEYFTPVVVSEYRNLQPNSLAIYRCMIDSAKKGFKLWNWGGTWESQEGVYRFKNRFGASDHRYNYFVKINNKEIIKASGKELQQEYDGFYVIPFDKLEGEVS